MQVKEIEIEKLDNIASEPSLPAGQFLQSSLWYELQKSLGRDCLALGVFDNNQLIAGTLLVQYNFPFGKKYFNCIRGPLVKFQMSNSKCQVNDQIPMTNVQIQYQKVIQKIVEYLHDNYKQKNVLFMRIEPPVDRVDFKNWQKGIEAKQVKTAWPKKTLILDLGKTEEELLSKMHHKWRYNIRLAERKGVQIEKCNNIDDFYVLAKETENRDKISFFGKNYFDKLLTILQKNNAGDLFVAKYNDQVISAIINVYYGNTAAYFFGASSDKHRNVMPNHLIQWNAIQEAKKRGYQYYDFWGIAENDDPADSWAGVTRFKRGFGGQEIQYGKSYDFVFNGFWYKMYNLARRFYKI